MAEFVSTSMPGVVSLGAGDFKTLLDAVEEERLSLVRASMPVPAELTARKEELRIWARRCAKNKPTS